MISDAQPCDSSSANPYLSQPATAATRSTAESISCASNKGKHETRLYVGNLHAAVDEYTLIQTFSKFGKISKLDFLFHKSGPQRGQPRGYAFVEYASPQEAMQAVAGAHNKTLKGRSISVTFATKSADGNAPTGIGPHRRDRRTAATESDMLKTTQLSLSKNAKQPQGTNAKIAAMEAKLAKLRQVKAPPVQPASTSAHLRAGVASLPAKPTFSPTDATRKPMQQQRPR